MSKKHFISDDLYQSKDKAISESLDSETIKSTVECSPHLINKQDPKSGNTYLYKSVLIQNYDLCEYLLEKNANPNIQNFKGEYALHQAVEFGNNKIINLLLEKGANPNLKQADGETPMHIACIKGDYKIVKLLLIYEANPLIKSNHNLNPLDYAIEKNQSKCIQLLKPIVEEKLKEVNENYRQKEKSFISGNRQLSKKEEEIGFQTAKNNDGKITDFNMPQTKFYINQTSKNKKFNHSFEKSSIKENEYQLTNDNEHNENRDSIQFMDEMKTLEDKLERIRNDLLKVNNLTENYQSFQLTTTNPDNQSKQGKNRYNSHFENINMNEIWNNLGKFEVNNQNIKEQNNSVSSKERIKSYFVGSSYNFENDIQNPNANFYENRNQEEEIVEKGYQNNEKIKKNELFNHPNIILNNNYTFNMNDYLDYTKQENYYDSNYGGHDLNCNQDQSRISYETNQYEDSKIMRMNSKTSVKYDKISDQYFIEEQTILKSSRRNTKLVEKISESFVEDGNILAIFSSIKNDIRDYNDDNNDEYMKMGNPNNQILRNSTMFNHQHIEEVDDGEYNHNNLFTDQTVNHSTSIKNVKYFNKKLISLDPGIINNSENLRNHKSPSIGKEEFEDEEDEDNDIDVNNPNSKEIFSFLKSIDCDNYTIAFLKNGFDDLSIMLEQMKSQNPLSDENLKEIGISHPGLRAKILIKLEENSNLYDFTLPVSIFNCLNSDDWESDHNVKSMHLWLSQIKMEKFLKNFVENGYHSMELLMFQMYSKNPLTDKIIEEEIKIDKIGYRTRIINKLKTDSKIFVEKLKANSMKIVAKGDEKTIESCRCLIF